MWIIEYVMEGVHEEFTLAPRENKLSAYEHTHSHTGRETETYGQMERRIDRLSGGLNS